MIDFKFEFNSNQNSAGYLEKSIQRYICNLYNLDLYADSFNSFQLKGDLKRESEVLEVDAIIENILSESIIKNYNHFDLSNFSNPKLKLRSQYLSFNFNKASSRDEQEHLNFILNRLKIENYLILKKDNSNYLISGFEEKTKFLNHHNYMNLILTLKPLIKSYKSVDFINLLSKMNKKNLTSKTQFLNSFNKVEYMVNNYDSLEENIGYKFNKK